MTGSAPAPAFLLVDKPAGCTSFDVVRWVKRALRERRVGHLGTLDPFATGLLVVAVGQATRLLPLLQGLPKTYEATAVLGATSSTLDRDGDVTETGGVIPTRRAVDDAIARFRGQISQVPPAFSALKVAGERAYDRARRGEAVELPPRTVTIHALVPARFEPPELAFTVTCSTGTYVRSLAADLGTALGCGAYLTALRRTAIGSLAVAGAAQLDLNAVPDVTTLARGARSVVEVLAGVCPVVDVDARAAVDLRHGRAIPLANASDGPAVVACDAVALASGVVERGVFRPRAVLGRA